MLRTLSFIIVLLFSFSLQASEYIESFHSDIDVRRNGDLYVTETIVVKAEGKSIRRGIYRDFPTHYEDAHGRNRVVGFEVLAVTRDGVPEPFKVNNQANGKRVYIGAANRYLSPGFYEYQINYLSTRQIGFFDDFDELRLIGFDDFARGLIRNPPDCVALVHTSLYDLTDELGNLSPVAQAKRIGISKRLEHR